MSAISDRRPIPASGPVEFFVFIFALLAQITFLSRLALPVDFMAANLLLSGLCSYYIVYGTPKKFGLYHIFFVFHLIFFSILPPLELAFRIVYWRGGAEVLDQYFVATVLSIGMMIIFDIAYRAAYRYRRHGRSRPRQMEVRYDARVALAASIVATFVVYWYNGFSPASVFFRGGEFVTRASLDHSITLIYKHAIYPLPTVALVFYLNLCKRKTYVTTLFLILAFIANPVTGTSRFQAASLYMAVFLSFVPSARDHRIAMSMALLFGMFFVFPILDLFRRMSEDFQLYWSLDFLYVGHFDAFQSLARVIDLHLVTWGAQFLGAVMFFVPRGIWPDKPIGSGATVADEIGLSFSNVSMTFIGEGYINGGVLGSVVFVAVLAWIFARMDAGIDLAEVPPSTTHRVFYFFLLGLAFFMMRGDLLSSFAYTVGVLSSVFGLSKLSAFLSTRKA